MNNHQKEVERAKLDAELKQLRALKAEYERAAKEIREKLRLMNGKINVLLKDIDNLDEKQRSILQSQIYHQRYQEALKKQIDEILEGFDEREYQSIEEYLKEGYEISYTGTMYDLSKQGIPLVIPIDQKAVTKAMTNNSKLSVPLYKRLGIDIALLSKQIKSTVSRGIAMGDSYNIIARNLNNDSKVGFNRAMRIARTEGHRVQIEAANDAQHLAKEEGTDIVKQWDATLDGRTRPLHRELDGQIRELDEPFDVGGIQVMYPSAFGLASQDINCRCALLQRAKWALDDDELERLKARAEYFGLDRAKDFEAFRKAYLKNPPKPVRIDIAGVTCKKELRKYGFGDGANGIQKTVDAIIYTVPDGTQFVFPKSYDKQNQTMTPEMAIACWNRVPQEIREQAQKVIEFVDYENPQDSYWRKVYKDFDRSYATGGNTITFYKYEYAHDMDYVIETYCHEAGHYIDKKIATIGINYSEEYEWQNAMMKDERISGEKSPTAYGENSSGEDFAESISEYVKDKKKFKSNFPNRALIIEQILVKS